MPKIVSDIKFLSRVAMSVCVGVQDSGGVAAACYLRNLSTERRATGITTASCKHMIFLFEKFFKAETACRVTTLISEIFNLLIIMVFIYCIFEISTDLTDWLIYWNSYIDIMTAMTYNANKEIKSASQN